MIRGLKKVKPSTLQARRRKFRRFFENLEPESFCIEDYVSESSMDSNGEPCGTVCCVIGWLPAVFPARFIWEDSGCRIGIAVRYIKPSSNGKRVEGECNFENASELDSHLGLPDGTTMKHLMYSELYYEDPVLPSHVVKRLDWVFWNFPIEQEGPQ